MNLEYLKKSKNPIVLFQLPFFAQNFHLPYFNIGIYRNLVRGGNMAVSKNCFLHVFQ